MSAHTPGPWEISGIYTELKDEISQVGGNAICTVWTRKPSPDPRRSGTVACDEGQANARLILAAPDMLAALREAESCMLIVEPRSDKAEYLRILGVVTAAIAKAEGR